MIAAAVMVEAIRYLAMAIAASQRLGWIAIGIYVQRMGMPTEPNPFYKTLLEYHRAMNNDYHLVESCMSWADDYRMVMFNELGSRLDAIDDNWSNYLVKEQRKNTLLRRASRARLEMDDWYA